MPEKVDRLSDLGVTKLRTTCPFACIAKKQETKKLHNSQFYGIFWRRQSQSMVGAPGLEPGTR
jgi:hypothetical protein